MKVKIYSNYGCLAHDYKVIYSMAPIEGADLSEPVWVEVPGEYKLNSLAVRKERR